MRPHLLRYLPAPLSLTFSLLACDDSGGGNSLEPLTFSLGGTITGLTGTAVLADSLGDSLTLTADGPFTLADEVPAGSRYHVLVTTQPAGQHCDVANAAGTLSADVTDVAVTCAVLSFTLTTTAAGPGSVARTPDLATYPWGTPAELTAVPDSGFEFTGWSGDRTGRANPDSFTMTADMSVTATFASATWTLTVTRTGIGAATTGDQAIACGQDCTEDYPDGTVVTLFAIPIAVPSTPVWTGCDQVNGTVCTITMTADRSLRVVFQ